MGTFVFKRIHEMKFFQKKTFPSKQEKGLKFKGQTTLNGYAQLNLLPHLTGWDLKGRAIVRFLRDQVKISIAHLIITVRLI